MFGSGGQETRKRVLELRCPVTVPRDICSLGRMNDDRTDQALFELLERWRDEAVKAGKMITRITVAYEAGRDGFWLARQDGARERLGDGPVRFSRRWRAALQPDQSPARSLHRLFHRAHGERLRPARQVAGQAVGLMQVTPEAGRDTAKRFGVAYDWNGLVSDPVYNTQMGAAEVAALLKEYRGSYIMTFAGYNAGRGRVRQWVAQHGDPRDPKVDAVDWVERIPFAETRNYVQRVLENLQVYRARFGASPRWSSPTFTARRRSSRAPSRPWWNPFRSDQEPPSFDAATYRRRVEIVRPAPSLCRVNSLRASGNDRQHEQRGGSGRDLADRDHGISPLSTTAKHLEIFDLPTCRRQLALGDRQSYR